MEDSLAVIAVINGVPVDTNDRPVTPVVIERTTIRRGGRTPRPSTPWRRPAPLVERLTVSLDYRTAGDGEPTVPDLFCEALPGSQCIAHLTTGDHLARQRLRNHLGDLPDRATVTGLARIAFRGGRYFFRFFFFRFAACLAASARPFSSFSTSSGQNSSPAMNPTQASVPQKQGWLS